MSSGTPPKPATKPSKKEREVKKEEEKKDVKKEEPKEEKKEDKKELEKEKTKEEDVNKEESEEKEKEVKKDEEKEETKEDEEKTKPQKAEEKENTETKDDTEPKEVKEDKIEVKEKTEAEKAELTPAEDKRQETEESKGEIVSEKIEKEEKKEEQVDNEVKPKADITELKKFSVEKTNGIKKEAVKESCGTTRATDDLWVKRPTNNQSPRPSPKTPRSNSLSYKSGSAGGGKPIVKGRSATLPKPWSPGKASGAALSRKLSWEMPSASERKEKSKEVIKDSPCEEAIKEEV